MHADTHRYSSWRWIAFKKIWRTKKYDSKSKTNLVLINNEIHEILIRMQKLAKSTNNLCLEKTSLDFFFHFSIPFCCNSIPIGLFKRYQFFIAFFKYSRNKYFTEYGYGNSSLITKDIY